MVKEVPQLCLNRGRVTNGPSYPHSYRNEEDYCLYRLLVMLGDTFNCICEVYWIHRSSRGQLHGDCKLEMSGDDWVLALKWWTRG